MKQISALPKTLVFRKTKVLRENENSQESLKEIKKCKKDFWKNHKHFRWKK